MSPTFGAAPRSKQYRVKILSKQHPLLVTSKVAMQAAQTAVPRCIDAQARGATLVARKRTGGVAMGMGLAFRRLGFLALFAALALHAGPAAFAVTGDSAEFVKLADDVYAYVGRRNDANAMVIVTRQGVVLVDTGNNQPDTRDLAAKIRSVTDQPVRFVVITQYHGDHFGGSPLFTPPATLIVHDRVARDIAAMKPYQIKS